MKNKIILLFAILLAGVAQAQDRILPKGSVAAVSEKYYDIAGEAAASNDLVYLQELLDSGLVILTGKDIEVIVLDYNMISATKVRVRGQSLVIWVDGSKLKRY